MKGLLWELLIKFASVNKHSRHGLVSYWSISKTTFPLRPLGQMIRNLARRIYWRTSIGIAHFVLIHYQIWLPQAILGLDWSISKIRLLWNCSLPKWTEIWWEALMEISVFSFLKVEWKVSDTRSAHWASSFLLFLFKWTFVFCYHLSIYLLLTFFSCYLLKW